MGLFRHVSHFLIRMTEFPPGKLKDFFKYFNEDNPRHRQAVDALQEEIEALDRSLMTDDAHWVLQYRKQDTAPVGGYFTPFLLQQLTGYSHSLFEPFFVNDLNDLMESTGFANHIDAMRMLYANLAHESANFKYMVEIDPGYYLNNRLDLGNRLPGDGPRFRGCGPLQVTGRTHFEAFYHWLKKHKGIDDPNIVQRGTEYVANKYPFLIAVSWIERNDLLNVCLTKGFDACCVRINGGFNGIADRRAKYKIAKQFIV